MITLFATEEIPITDVQNILQQEGAEISSVQVITHQRNIQKISDCTKAFLICPERSVLTVGERTRQVRDLVGENVSLIVCSTQFGIENKKTLIRCGATQIISPKSFTVPQISERILAQIISEKSLQPFQFENLYGATRKMREVYQHIDILAKLEEPVLIVGETGTGKELVASALHTKSNRNAEFIGINIAEITPELLPSELFGHEQGAFTNAVKSRSGLLAEAGKGTIFLDEIGELDLASQAKLLRVLEEKKVRKVGSNKWDDVPARFVLATNRNLEEECAEKRFRFDLFQRLKGFVIQLPPLRERKADILLLVSHFIDEYNSQYKKELKVSDDFLDDLFQSDWEGNVRELRSVIRKAAAYADSNNYLSKITLRELSSLKNHNKANAIEFDPTAEDLDSFVRKAEKHYLNACLSRTNGNVSAASKLAGIARATFYKKLGIEKQEN